MFIYYVIVSVYYGYMLSRLIYFIQVLFALTLLFAVTVIATDGVGVLRRGPRAVDEEEYHLLIGAFYF